MNKIATTLILAFLCLSLHAQFQTDTNLTNNGFFINPVFAGDYPDPSILREGDDFYLVHSSFEYYPGLLIWHSTDLINWTPLTSALNKYVGSVWAPDLVKHHGKYFIYFPANNTNYVVTADNINGPWSDPIKLDVSMIDPGHVADEKGNRYLYFSSGSYVPLSKDGLSITGEAVHSYAGWEIPRHWTIECFCMEGPKLFKRGDYYYLTVAEGGTAGPATGHMVIQARSKSALGPWENAPHNPILRAKSPQDKWWSVGHSTIFDDAKGNWYMIFHGYENGYYNMGRQTMIVPIEWTEDGWYKIPDDIDIAKPIKLLTLKNKSKNTYALDDTFEGSELGAQWRFFKDPEKNRYELKEGSIVINGKGSSVANCSPMLIIPSDHAYTADVELEIEGDAVGGIVLFYSEKIASGILADKEHILANLRGWQFPTEKNVIKRKVHLRLKNRNNTVDMFYSLDGVTWIKIENSFESSAYHHNVLSGFMSLRIGLCAIGEGKVIFKNFEYSPIK